MTSQFKVTNEKGVEYLFYRNHEKLEFEKIIKIQLFPDVIALRSGVEVGIEIEYNLSGFLYHYIVQPHRWDWRYENCRWYPYLLDDSGRFETSNRYYHSIPDKNKKYIVDDNGYLAHKTLKDRCQYVICWNKNCELPEDIDVIRLSDKRL